MNKIANNLKRLRLQKNLTQEQAAEVLGVSSQTISRWECDTTCPDIMLLPEIARLYCVTIDDLFREDSSAYDNYAQRLASVYEISHKPADFLKADTEFNKLKESGNYSLEDCRVHGCIISSMMCYCKQLAVQKFKHITDTFEKEKNIAPENKVYWKTRYQIIHYYVELGQAEQACQNQENRLKKHPDNYMEWTVLIYLYYYARKHEAAYDCFKKAEKMFSDKWEIYDVASYVCRALKKYDEAIRCSDKSYELSQEYLDAVYSKAFCYEEMGDYKSAYNTWMQIIDTLKKEGYDVEVQREEKRAQMCLEKLNQA